MRKEQEYIDIYKQLHKQAGWFPGKTKLRYKDIIHNMVDEYDVTSILDYGCGKGERWDEMELGITPRLYDPAVEQHNVLPAGQFDMVMCVDVLEHVPEEGLPTIIQNVAAAEPKCVFWAIGMEPANAKLPNGENAHCTLRSEQFWMDRMTIPGVPTTYAFGYHQTGKEVVREL